MGYDGKIAPQRRVVQCAVAPSTADVSDRDPLLIRGSFCEGSEAMKIGKYHRQYLRRKLLRLATVRIALFAQEAYLGEMGVDFGIIEVFKFLGLSQRHSDSLPLIRRETELQISGSLSVLIK